MAACQPRAKDSAGRRARVLERQGDALPQAPDAGDLRAVLRQRAVRHQALLHHLLQERLSPTHWHGQGVLASTAALRYCARNSAARASSLA